MGEKIDFGRLRVLVVDDEFFMLDVVARALRGLHVKDVIKAGNVQEARDLIAKERLDLDCIIADFNMRPTNGLQFLQRIRMGQEARITPTQAFIMLTGNARSDVVTASVALDVNAYLVKPVAAAKLGQALERAASAVIKLKSPEHYGAVNIGVTEIYNDAEDKYRLAPLVSPKESIKQPAEQTSFLDRKTKVLGDAGPSRAPEEKPEREPIVSIRRCGLAKLKEKMVIGEDIEDDDGAVLIRKGTTLTLKMVDRLRSLAADRKFVLIERTR